MKKYLACIAAALLLGGCASPDATTASESPSVREYPTGSNIPRKNQNRDASAEGVRVYSREDLERMQQSTHGSPIRTPGN